ncbi:MAG TPA: ATP-binding protein [Thermoleophilaceae bacterium]|nr:ATP-binding protein [Thermoleophilaceae bacterium]
MSLALVAAAGWLCAIGTAVRLRIVLGRVARAGHELRGASAALALASASAARRPGGAALAAAVEGQVDRLRAGLDDLAGRPGAMAPVPVERAVRDAAAAWALAAPDAGRRVEIEGQCPRVPGGAGSGASGTGPPVLVPRGPAAKALGNLLANSMEHGRGDVRVRIAGGGGAVRVEVADDGGGPWRVAPPGGFVVRPGSGRGLGMGIAAGAARAMGGRLRRLPGGPALEIRPRAR